MSEVKAGVARPQTGSIVRGGPRQGRDFNLAEVSVVILFLIALPL